MMRSVVVLFAAVFCFSHPGIVSAVFYNDSHVIEIGDGTPPDPVAPDEGSGGTPGGSSGDQGSSDEGGTGGSDTSSSSGDAGSGSDSGGGGGGNGTGSPSGGSAGGSSGSGTQEAGSGSGGTTTEEDLINLLVSTGALGGAGSGAASDVSAGSAAAGSGSAVHVDGARVRDVLRDTIDLRTMLQYWRRNTNANLSTEEYGLIAASTALRDANVQSVSFSVSAFEITYRSRGYLFAIVPISFPVRVEIVPDAARAEVRVRLPWYRFFVRTFFTANSLSRDIAELVEQTKEGEEYLYGDEKAILFEAVSAFLRQRVGTIGDSVLLGTRPQ